MARFIPVDKMKKLREASRNGDERAKRIIAMQLGGTEDFSGLLDEFFTPAPKMPETAEIKPEKEPVKEVEVVGDSNNNLSLNLKKFLEENGVKEGDDNYEEFVEEYYSEYPNEKRPEPEIVENKKADLTGVDLLIEDELEAVRGYDEQILAVANSDLPDSMKKGIIATYNEIKSEELEHIEELKKIKNSLEKNKVEEGL